MKRTCSGCGKQYDSSYEVCPYCGTERSQTQQWEDARLALALPEGWILNQRYQVVQLLESDSFSYLYLAVDLGTQNRQNVLIREFFPVSTCERDEDGCGISIKNAADYKIFQKGREAFLRDGRIQASLQIPGLVSGLGTFTENRTGYLVLEDPGRISLEQYLQSGKILSLEESLATMIPVMEALDRLHEQGILHLDVTADHVIFTADGEVKLMDARQYALPVYQAKPDYFPGFSDGYRAPELVRHMGKMTEAADVYSVCATLGRMMTGQVLSDPERDLSNTHALGLNGRELPPDENKIHVIINGLISNPTYRIPDMKSLMREFTSIEPVERREDPGLPSDQKQAAFKNIDAPYGGDGKAGAGRKKGGPARIFKVAGFLALAVILTVGGVFAYSRFKGNKQTEKVETGSNEGAPVPDLYAVPFTKAKQDEAIKDAKLQRYDAVLLKDLEKFLKEQNKYNPDEYEKLEKADIIIDQDPEVGKPVKSDKTINVTVTAKPVTLEKLFKEVYPNSNIETLKGYKLTGTMKKELEKTFNLETTKESSNVIPGYMIRAEGDGKTYPAEEEEIGLTDEIPKYCRMKVITSKGKEIKNKGKAVTGLKKTDFEGKAIEDVLKLAEKNDFFIGLLPGKKTYEYSLNAPKDTVAGVSDTAGTKSSKKSTKKGKKDTGIKKGDQILLTLSKGPKGVYTKDELEKLAEGSESAVKAKLEKKNLSVNTKYANSSSVAKGDVISATIHCNHDKADLDQNSQAFDAHWGDRVTLLVSMGPKPEPKQKQQSGGGSGGGSGSGNGDKKEKKRRTRPSKNNDVYVN